MREIVALVGLNESASLNYNKLKSEFHMAAIFNKKELTDDEYVIKYALIYLGMRKVRDENVAKILNDDNNR